MSLLQPAPLPPTDPDAARAEGTSGGHGRSVRERGERARDADDRLDPVRGVVNAAILSVPLWIGIGAALRRLRHW